MGKPNAPNFISSEANLKKTWFYLRSRLSKRQKQTKGVDNESFTDFSRRVPENIRQISVSLKSGYPFSPLRAFFVPKANGKRRIICVPTTRDRIVQRAILDYLSDGDRCGLANKVSFGFLKNRGVKKATLLGRSLRRSHQWVFRTDITSFFDQIHREYLAVKLKGKVHSAPIRKLLLSALNSEIEESNRLRKALIQGHGIKPGVGVRQGMPLSPFFSNVVLAKFDSAVERKNLKMVRYADDIVVFCKSEKECHKVDAFVRHELEKISLSIPKIGESEKTQIFDPGQAAEFLGVEITPHGTHYSVVVSKKQLNYIKGELFKNSNISELVQRGILLNTLAQRMDGQIAGYLGAYNFCDNFSDLEEKLEIWRKEIFERLFRDGLGLDISTMSDVQRRFLGV